MDASRRSYNVVGAYKPAARALPLTKFAPFRSVGIFVFIVRVHGAFYAVSNAGGLFAAGLRNDAGPASTHGLRNPLIRERMSSTAPLRRKRTPRTRPSARAERRQRREARRRQREFLTFLILSFLAILIVITIAFTFRHAVEALSVVSPGVISGPM